MSAEEFQEVQRIISAAEYLKQAEMSASALFNKAYKVSEKDEGKKEELNTLSKHYSEMLGFNEKGEMKKEKIAEYHNPLVQAQALLSLTEGLGQIHPEIWKPAEDFALEKTAQSYGNVAFNAWKKFGWKKEKDTTPLVLIENPPAGGGLSRGEDLKKLVQESRKRFVDNAVGEKLMSKGEAEKEAEKLIGVTWDVGHINQLRQFGFTGKDIIKEAEEVAPYLKHMHLSDNFGMENIEMPMGMGNVDFKEVMEALKKKGAKTEDVRKIVEAAHWWQFFQSNPVGPTLEALGTPLYSTKGPYWNQIAGFQQGYFGGYGMMLPQINYESFGTGFSNLPSELGGQRVGGQRSRMGGAPME